MRSPSLYWFNTSTKMALGFFMLELGTTGREWSSEILAPPSAVSTYSRSFTGLKRRLRSFLQGSPIHARNGTSGSLIGEDSGIPFSLPGSPKEAGCSPIPVLSRAPFNVFNIRKQSSAWRGAALPVGSPPFYYAKREAPITSYFDFDRHKRNQLEQKWTYSLEVLT